MVKQSKLDSICESRRGQRLFQRSAHPQLPSNKMSFYGGAKRLEYDGDIKGALAMYHKAMISGDRADSAMKDIAGLLNMLGKTKEAIEFLKCNSSYVENKVGYTNLIGRLEIEQERDAGADIPRSVMISVNDPSLGAVSLALCDRLFPNPAKIRRILFLEDDGSVAAVHFATHSAARKAIQVKKVVMSVTTDWCSSFEERRMRAIEEKENKESREDCINVEQVPEHLAAFADVSALPLYYPTDALVIQVTNELLNESANLAEPTVANDSLQKSGDSVLIQTPYRVRQVTDYGDTPSPIMDLARFI